MKLKYLIYLLLSISITGCSKTWHISSQKAAYHRFDDRSGVSEDKEINQLIAPYRDQMSAEMSEVIGISDMSLTKQKPESTLGNWFADILKEEASRLLGKNVDCAFQNYGGIRIPSLSRGEVTTGKIFELMPFDNLLVVVETNGSVLKQLLDKIAHYGGWPSSEGLSFEIKDTIAENILINGLPLDTEAQYTIALPDYIANGGDNCDFLKSQKITNLNTFIRDAIIENLKIKHQEGIVIHAEIEGRIKFFQSKE